MCRWPKDLSQDSYQLSEDLYHQKYHSFTIQAIEWGCDPCAAVYSLCAVLCSSCSCPRLRSSLRKAYTFLTCSLTYSFPYSTRQALRAKSWAVFPPCGFFHPTCAHLYLLSVPVAKTIATVATLPRRSPHQCQAGLQDLRSRAPVPPTARDTGNSSCWG